MAEEATRRSPLLKERVAHAYWKYGRFCSSHPFLCMAVSALTVFTLSYPALSRLRLPSSSPVDVYRTRSAVDLLDSPRPDWLLLRPSLFVQQLAVRARVHPWPAHRLTAEHAVKAALGRAFDVQRRLREFVSTEGARLDDLCLVARARPSSSPLLPERGCVVLSPALFWHNDQQRFFEDATPVETVFAEPCTTDMCSRDLLLGMPTRLTGVKRQYHTNRQRTIEYLVTIILSSYDEQFISELTDRLNASEQFVAHRVGADALSTVHVFYRPRKYVTDNLPLILSYCVLALYVYYSASKVEMVKSKWGLAFAAVVNVACSLTMAAGICNHFELTPSMWGAELFPYIAMVVGLENTLCVTRSVVSTPVSLDVRSRIAHGLSKEGWYITKNFLIELSILSVGLLTGLPELQEFCTFAFIGLVVDFYMQLVFYAPCLTFDLWRMGSDDKRRFGLMLFRQEPVRLNVYPGIYCPLALLFPAYFRDAEGQPPGAFRRVQRVRSEAALAAAAAAVAANEPPRPPPSPPTQRLDAPTSSGHRRAVSVAGASLNVERRRVPQRRAVDSFRLRWLYFWTRTRFFQRVLMVATVIWIVWFVCIIRQYQLLTRFQSISPADDVSPHDSALTNSSVTSADKPDVGQPAQDTYRPSGPAFDWKSWQKRTFRWWPALFDAYNLSLSGHYISILPPIALTAAIEPTDPAIVFSGGGDAVESVDGRIAEASAVGGDSGGSELKRRMSWLEIQMTAVLVLSCGIFASVALFIVYVCFAGRGAAGVDEATDDTPRAFKPTHTRVGSRAIVESVPLVFSGHSADVECVDYAPAGALVVSTCVGGGARVWNATTAECVRLLPRAAAARPPRNGVVASPPTNGTALRRRAVTAADEGSGGDSPSTPRAMSVLQSPSGPQAAAAERHCSPVWSMIVRQNVVLLGCASGVVELWDTDGVCIGGYQNSSNSTGVTHMELQGSRLIVARLNGVIEFADIRSSEAAEGGRRLTCHHVRSVTAHQHPINCMQAAAAWLVTASADHTLKLFDLRAVAHTRTLYGHNASVLAVIVDEVSQAGGGGVVSGRAMDPLQLIVSSCDQGVVCCWRLTDGALLRTHAEAAYTRSYLALAVTDAYVIGYSRDAHLWLWRKSSGELVTRIRQQTAAACVERPSVVALSERVAATACAGAVQFWDLQYKMMLRAVGLDECEGASVGRLVALDALSVVCPKGNALFRVNFPMIRLS